MAAVTDTDPTRTDAERAAEDAAAEDADAVPDRQIDNIPQKGYRNEQI